MQEAGFLTVEVDMTEVIIDPALEQAWSDLTGWERETLFMAYHRGSVPSEKYSATGYTLARIKEENDKGYIECDLENFLLAVQRQAQVRSGAHLF